MDLREGAEEEEGRDEEEGSAELFACFTFDVPFAPSLALVPFGSGSEPSIKQVSKNDATEEKDQM